MVSYSRRWAVLLAIATVGLAGCTSKEERAAEESTAEAGWSAGFDALKIGLAGPLTGPFATLGVGHQNSLQVMIDHLNAEGGLGGAKLQLEVRDTGLDPAKAVQAATEFAGDQTVVLAVGPSITAFYNAAKGAYEANRKVNCQPTVAAGTFADLKYGFRAQESWELSVTKILTWLKAEGVPSIGLIYEADETGKYVDELLTEHSPSFGLTYAGYQSTRPDDQSHRAQVDALKDAEALFISSSSSGATTMGALEAAGYKGQIVSGSGMQNIAFLEAAGDSAQGAVFAATNYQWPIRDRNTWQPGYRAHIESVEKVYGFNRGPLSGATSAKGSGWAADCLFAYAKAADKVQSIDPDKIVGALLELDVPAGETPSGNSLTPDASHEFYDEGDVHLYKWSKDAEGWFTEDVTPK